MSDAVIPLVMDMEKQAAALLGQARADADALRARAKEQRQQDAQHAQQKTGDLVRQHEEQAAQDREKQTRQLRDEQKTQRDTVENLPAATLDDGVRLVLDALTGASAKK